MIKAGGGVILNASSVVALYGNFGQTNYAATKAGVIAMTRTRARDPGSTFIPNFVLDDIIRQARAGPIGRLSAGAGDMHQYLLDERLREIRTPVDLLWGESDRLMSVEYAKRMLEKLPAARLTLIPRCGHVPQQECQERFTSSLLKVLGQEPPNGNR